MKPTFLLLRATIVCDGDYQSLSGVLSVSSDVVSRTSCFLSREAGAWRLHL